MEERIICLLNKYISKTISSAEVDELRQFIDTSGHNKYLVTTFLSLHKSEMQSAFLKNIDKDVAWESIERRLSRHSGNRIVAWVSGIAATVAIIVSVTIFFMPQKKQSPTLAEVIDSRPVDRAVITLNTGENIEIDTNDPQPVSLNDGKISFEYVNGKLVYHGHSEQSAYNKLNVMEGSSFKMQLPDGTNITLASGARLAYPVGGDNRNVKLDGEAFFDVVHDEAKPFTVDCPNGARVTVLGTRFNVSAHKGKPVVVTVESGRVGVLFSGKTVFLNGNEQATFSKGQSESVSNIDANLYTSWASGIYEFNEVPIKVIARQLSLWYGVEFEFASQQLQDRKFTGALLRNEKLGYTLSLLSEVSNLKFVMKDDKILVK